MPSSSTEAAIWTGVASALAFMLSFITYALGRERIAVWMNTIQAFFSPYTQITMPEYAAERFERSDFYAAIEAYLYDQHGKKVRKLTSELGSHMKQPLTYVDDSQQIIDTYKTVSSRATVWWHGYKTVVLASNVMRRPGEEERRFYRVSFHRRFRDFVVDEYLPHVIEKGREAITNNRQRRLFTNNPEGGIPSWSYADFQHPATFAHLAMKPELKQKIQDDLDNFKNRKDYYAKVGKAWKRGYLLYGPPGTGKSTMVSAMANHLNYDVYDLELTAVKSNNHLRRLFIETTGKSILVIEDIDRSLNLTGGTRRADKKMQPSTSTSQDEDAEYDNGIQQLTLSGLLNFIDGLWSACGGERIIVFTTNDKSKLDPVVIRTGRMDMEIQMSYCTYEGFKVLAGNYLDINEHDLFERYGEIQPLLGPAEMTPADVAEHLMSTELDESARIRGLIETLRTKAEAASVETGTKP